jgi:hypothetical protein
MCRSDRLGRAKGEPGRFGIHIRFEPPEDLSLQCEDESTPSEEGATLSTREGGHEKDVLYRVQLCARIKNRLLSEFGSRRHPFGKSVGDSSRGSNSKVRRVHREIRHKKGFRPRAVAASDSGSLGFRTLKAGVQSKRKLSSNMSVSSCTDKSGHSRLNQAAEISLVNVTASKRHKRHSRLQPSTVHWPARISSIHVLSC